jgi:S1-C subfamily serine protease
MISAIDQLNEEIACLVEHARLSLVIIGDGHGSCGAGTVWHPDGLVVTNSHVVRGRRCEVTLPDGRTTVARLLARNEKQDLAALVVDTEGLAAIEPGDSASLEPGQFVLALGHPGGLKGVATAGIYMGTEEERLRVLFTENLLAVNLPLRPGNSGGPLIDAEGKMTGINTAMTGHNTGLAIPVNVAKVFLKESLGSR